MRVVLVLAALSGCFSTPARPAAGDAGSGAAWLEGYAHRKLVTIHRTEGSATLTDFMVSISIAADADLLAAARPMGADIAFTRADGTTPVLHELVDYNTATGGFDTWLRIAELPGGDTDVYLYYGGAPHVSLSPWPVAYRGVWHLAGKSLERETDSIGKVPDLMASAAGELPAIVDGIVGRGRDYRIGSSGEGDELCTATDALDFGMTSLSYSMWFYIRSLDGAFDAPFVHGGNNTTTPGFGVELGNVPWAAGISDGGGALTDYQETDIGAPILNGWVQLVVAVDRSPAPGAVRIYVNGVRRILEPIKSTIGSLTASAPSRLCIGSDTYRIDGMLDEVQVRGGVWTDDEIDTQFVNLTKRPTFQSLGSEETAP